MDVVAAADGDQVVINLFSTGLGGSEGPGTYVRYREMGVEKKLRFYDWEGPSHVKGEVSASGLVRSCGPKRVVASSAPAVADQQGLQHLRSRSARVDQLTCNVNVLMGDFNMSAVADGGGNPIGRNCGTDI